MRFGNMARTAAMLLLGLTLVMGMSSPLSARADASERVASQATNSYAYGHSTYYAYERRLQLGRPIGNYWGNAKQWLSAARAAGFATGTTPQVGAVAWSGSGPYGHVAIVEAVSGGQITVTEMNFRGNWNRVTSRTVVGTTFPAYIY